jgi:DNA-binding transcriptional MerR regulator/DNA gyrase inhibitor GyrI
MPQVLAFSPESAAFLRADRSGIKASSLDSPLTGGRKLATKAIMVVAWDHDMFTIGEFSRITGLTVKALRFYHEEGLLEPTSVDDETGYRYYDASKVERARTILFLKDLDFSLAEIGELLARAEDQTDLTAVIQQQRKVIDEKIRRLKRVRQSLDAFLAAQRQGRALMSTSATFQCEEKTLPPMKIAALRMKAPYSECGQGFARIGKRFWNQICGPAMLLCYDTEYQELADYETCMPVRGGAAADGIEVRELPGGECVALLHQGPYDQLSRSYEKAIGYAKAKGYTLVRPCREVYLKGPGMIFKGNPKKYLTEIQLMVERKG